MQSLEQRIQSFFFHSVAQTQGGLVFPPRGSVDWSWPLHHACMFIKCIEVSSKPVSMLLPSNSLRVYIVSTITFTLVKQAYRWSTSSKKVPCPTPVQVQTTCPRPCGVLLASSPIHVLLRRSAGPQMLGVTAVFPPNSFPARRCITTGDGFLAGLIFGPWLFLGAGMIWWGTRVEELVLVLVGLLELIGGGFGRLGRLA